MTVDVLTVAALLAGAYLLTAPGLGAYGVACLIVAGGLAALGGRSGTNTGGLG